MTTRPNVLFIISDQHNAKVLGHAGHPYVKTPHLDQLAAEGVRFENAICQNPICTPSRVSYLSGQYAHNHGYYGNEGQNPRGLPTVFGHFRRAGYRTGAIGKIHCPAFWVEDDCDVFQEAAGCSIGGNCRERRRYVREHNVRGHDYGAVSHDGCPDLCSYRDSVEGWSVMAAQQFMAESRKLGQAFMVQVSLPKPHQPYTPAQEFWDMYDEERMALAPNFAYDVRAAHKAPSLIYELERTQARTNWYIEPKTYTAAMRRKFRGYLGCVTHVDYAVGELLQWLRENGLEENTIVIYTSDHGDYACEHGLPEKAPGICSDAITRIPHIWRWPGVFPAGHVVRALVETTDLAPTLCALAGLPPMETADGSDIQALLRGGDCGVHTCAVTEFPFSKSIRAGAFRLVYYPRWFFADQYPDGFGELYNIEEDPWEMRNLYFDAAHHATVQELQTELMDWLVSTTRPATILPPYVASGEQWRTHYNNSYNADGKIAPARLRAYEMHNKLRL